MNDFYPIWEQWKKAAMSGSLLTEKHDPNSKTMTHDKYKTVLTLEMSGSLESVIVNKEFEEVEHYVDANDPKKTFYIIKPKTFDVVGYARHTGSFDDADSCDRLKIYSGSVQSWHTCAETSSLFNTSSKYTLLKRWDSFEKK